MIVITMYFIVANSTINMGSNKQFVNYLDRLAELSTFCVMLIW